MSAIFISHSSKDNVLAKAIERRLDHQHHHSVFLDLDPEKGIAGGQSWERTLYRKLRACRAVIALCTDEYLRSHWCFAEIALARMEGKPVIAILADPLDDAATLPGILMERQLIDLRKNTDEGFTRLWRALEELDLRGVASDWNPKDPPYLGLSAYQEEHAPVFVGREEESLAGLELLDRGAPGLIMVLGASGSGKSSLVRAGILPRLRPREDWLILDPFRPGRDPWAELTESLVQAYGRYAKAHLDESRRRERIRESIRVGWHVPAPADSGRAAGAKDEAQVGHAPDDRLRRLIDLLERLHEDPPPPLTDRVRNYLEWSLDDLRRLCAPERPPLTSSASPHETTPLVETAQDLRRLANRRDARVLLVIDQFEELLGQEQVAAGAAGFLELLRASIETGQSLLTVLCTMRSDFLGHFQHHSALQGVDFESLSLGPMRIDGMRRVIEMPARLAAIEIEEGLADRLLADTETPDALPLLSFTLWVMCRDRREDGKLEVSAYERLGGLQGTIAREADAVLASAVHDQKDDELRKALLQMARLSEDGSYARRPADWDSPDVQRVESLLAKLVDRRVLVSRMEGDRRVIEVAHEALFRTWAPLRAWLENARAELLLKQQIERDAVTWRDSGRTPDTLWRGGRLLQARDLIADARRWGSGGEAAVAAEFVRAGVRRRKRQRATLATSVAAIIAVLTGFLVFALIQANRARKEQGRALDMARVAIAGDWLQKDPTSGALVLLEVVDPATRFAPRRLSEALNRGFISAEYRHTAPVHSIAISPDGSRVVTASARAAMVWEARNGRLLRTLPHDDMVIAAAFDPTGRFVVTRSGHLDAKHAGFDRTGNTARVWKVETGEPRFAVTHAEALNRAAFSPDGRFLVTASDDDTAQLWDVEAGRLRFTLRHQGDVEDAGFGPDGTILVTRSGRTAQFWSAGTGQPASRFTEEHDFNLASFAPDGAIVLTLGVDAVHAWDVGSGEPRQTFRHAAHTASFSADGRFLVTASDGDARVWDVSTGSERFEKPITQACLAFAAMTPDGSQVITASGHHHDRSDMGNSCAENAVRRWNAETGALQFVRQLIHGFDVMSAAFGPGSHVVAVNSVAGGGNFVRFQTRGHDSTARLWNIDNQDGRLQRTLVHEEPLSAASFSPDGRRMLTVAGAAVRLWESDPAAPPVVLRHEAPVNAAAFAVDGKDVVTASDDRHARVWDATTGQQRFAAKHADEVGDALLVAGGRLLATISASRVRLWTVTRGTAEVGGHTLELTGNVDSISSDDFSPDGRLVVVRSGRTVSVWDVEARKPRWTLKHGGDVNTAVFIAEGALLVTSADEKVVRVWDTTTGEPKFTFEHATEPATAVSPDGRTVLTVEFEGTAHFWDTGTGKERFTLQHGCSAREARFIGDGRMAMTWSYSTGRDCVAKVTLWDVATGDRRTIDSGNPVSVGFSRDARRMFALQDRRSESGTHDESLVRVWDLESAEERFAEPFVSAVPARIVSFSPDGQRLLLASGKRLLIFAVGGELLHSTLAGATTLCLSPEFRQQNLGESNADAVRAYEACERKHGRK